MPAWLLALGSLIAAGVVGTALKTGGADDSDRSLRPGDCINGLSGPPDRVACQGAHDGEVFGVFVHPADKDAPFPSPADRVVEIEDRCVQLFGPYVGRSMVGSGLYPLTIEPDERAWQDGDREVICVLAASQGTLMRSQRESGPGEWATEKAVSALTVGDCVMKGPAEEETTYSVVVIACDEPHDREVYALFDVTGSEFPGAEPVAQEGLEGCVARFADYVGTSFETSELDALSLSPTAESWELGDRGVVCLTMLIGDDTQLEGSVRQSGR